MRFLSQGIGVPIIAAVVLGLLFAALIGNDTENRAQKLQAAMAQLEEANAQLAAAGNTSHFEYSINNASIENFRSSLEREYFQQHIVMSALAAYALMVPVTTMLLALTGRIWLPRSSRIDGRSAIVEALGSQFFWINLANALFVGWMLGPENARSNYRLAFTYETFYCLLLMLLLGSASYASSRMIRVALNLPLPAGRKGYLLGDRLRWTIYATYVVVTALLWTGTLLMVTFYTHVVTKT